MTHPSTLALLGAGGAMLSECEHGVCYELGLLTVHAYTFSLLTLTRLLYVLPRALPCALPRLLS